MKIEYTNVKPLIEGLKEYARIIQLGVLPIIIASIDLKTGVININWMIVRATAIVVVLLAILKGADKDRHLTGKLEGDDNKTKGLTGY